MMKTTANLTAEQVAILAKIAVKFAELGVEADFVPPVAEGPIISAYRFFPTSRTRVSHLEALASDIAVTLGVEDVLIKRLPGESAVGVFVPNAKRSFIDFKNTVNAVWTHQASDLRYDVPLNLGVDHLGRPAIENLAMLPHLLIAGSTGAGKSTLLSSILATIVYIVNSNAVQLVLSDTKNVEFGHFIGAPHLLFPPATSVYQTLEQMDWVIDEMESRLKKLSKTGCRNVHEYNLICAPTGGRCTPLPFIVLVIDELADLLMDRARPSEGRGPSIGKIAESKLSTIVQKSRAAGVYVIASTQRPSVNVVIGSIKANFPARLSFRLPSEADSRTVLGFSGAEHLLSRGDMLFVSPNRPGVLRLHAPYASITDIQAAVEAAIQRSV